MGLAMSPARTRTSLEPAESEDNETMPDAVEARE